ncbi:MAG: homoserine dehydrogenase [Candidatus Methanomethylophilaceae archaeon]|nr:homoserine dehydrogenase [Candidatus Methanomethylophilaceae archaeon]
MLVNAELYVKDLPGQLVGSLEPISMVNGNIVGVVHNRERIVNQRICINVTFEVKKNEDVEALKKIWKAKDILIAKIGSVYETFTMEYLLLGTFTASYIENLMDEASNAMTLESVEVSYTSANGNATRTAMITAEVLTENDLAKLDKFLSAACREAGIIYIRGL